MTDLGKFIKEHKHRIHKANMHPRNSFFMAVKKDSEQKLKSVGAFKEEKTKEYLEDRRL